MNPDQLRDALEAEAARVEFGPDPLGAIRARTRLGSRRRLGLRLASFGGAVTVTVAAVVLGVVSCQPPLPAPLPPATTAPATPSPTPTTAAAVAVTVPVYWVGPSAGRAVLYREFRQTTVPADTLEARIAAALRLALSGPPLDPDYATPWPAGATIRGVTVASGVSTVDLSVAAPSPIAVQQLVWTATAVAADRGASLIGVRLSVDGVPAPEVVKRADATQTLAALWLIAPQQGATVTGTVTVQLDGSVFEAAARLRVRDAGGRVVSDQPVLLSVGAPQRGQATVTLTLPAGNYTVEVYSVSLKDGSEQNLDGHRITVR
jgi:Immunoglobulin-like domain of bacterial spore germination/Sporulation and spore germination